MWKKFSHEIHWQCRILPNLDLQGYLYSAFEHVSHLSTNCSLDAHDPLIIWSRHHLLNALGTYCHLLQITIVNQQLARPEKSVASFNTTSIVQTTQTNAQKKEGGVVRAPCIRILELYPQLRCPYPIHWYNITCYASVHIGTLETYLIVSYILVGNIPWRFVISKFLYTSETYGILAA